jgi:hypothetical protein
VGGELAPVFPLDEYEGLPIDDEEGIEARDKGEEEEREVPIALPETEGRLGPEEEKRQKKDEKKGYDDDDVEKNENSPKFHAPPLL